MKKINIKAIIINFLIVLLLIVLFLTRSNVSLTYNINNIFWILFVIGLIIYSGIPKDKTYYKSIIIRYTIICCLSYLIIIYLGGLILGFSSTVYKHDLFSIIKNIAFPIIVIISQSLIRFIYCNYCSKNKKYLIIFTALMSLVFILLNSINYSFYDGEAKFIFICLYVLPIIAQQSLYTYLSTRVSYVPCLIISMVLELVVYIVPIYPNLGNFLFSVLYIALPFAIYIITHKVLRYNDLKQVKFKRFVVGATTLPLLLFAGIMVILVSGIFKYKMVAIVSNSMNPTYYRGDAVVYDQKITAEELKVGEILSFYADNKIVTHRIVKKTFENDKYYFVTKGDNNDSEDAQISEDVIYGRVVFVVKYFGFPTIWFNEMFERR